MLQNIGIQDITSWISSRFNYVQGGTSSSDPSLTTFTDLVTPVGSRYSCTKDFATTYTTGDTATFVSILTASGDYTINEVGLFKDSTTSSSDVMLSRQVLSTPISATNGSKYGIIWQVISSRG